jgi:OmpA-OmpF porin, OOP family
MRSSLLAGVLVIAGACTAPGAVPVCSPTATFTAPMLRCAASAAPPAPAPVAPLAPPPRVAVTEEKIELTETVQFETDSSTLLPQSRTLLDEVATQLQSHPEITKIQVEGYTDSTSTKKHNQTLSEQRAAAVKAYLMDKGIATDRLATKGFGQDRPVGDNATEEGRFKNRRVEFSILKRQ